MAAFEQVERAGEIRVARDAPRLPREENLAHAREVDARFHLIGLLGPVLRIDGPGGDRSRSIGLQFDPLQVDAAFLDREPGAHVGPHRHVVLNRHRAAVERRLAVIGRPIRDGDLEVARHRTPRLLVIVVGELPFGRPHPLERRREPLRPVGLVVVAAAELREIVSVLPLFDQHLPPGQRDAFDRHFLADERRPIERHLEAARRQERAVGRPEALDREIVDDDGAGQQMKVEAADVNGPFQLLRAFSFGPPANGRAEVDCQRDNDRHGENRRDDSRRAAAESICCVLAKSAD